LLLLFLNLPAIKSTQNVNGIFNGKQLLNQEFTRTSLRDNISGSNILHIATHGRFVPVDANASFLLLGNGDKLFIKELKNLIDDLNQVHLVVLSACQTALGGLGDDGVEISGISYYFLNGGAKAVIASLWAVNDDSTRQLMQHFYANLVTNGTQSQITKVKALQKAQLSLLHSDNESESAKTKSGQVVIEKRLRSNVQTRSKTNFAHPYYWAPFILIGNGL
jgi:CHAT domain-containing protein